MYRQCHKNLTSSLEPMLQYTGITTKYLPPFESHCAIHKQSDKIYFPLLHNRCCHKQAMPQNTYLFLKNTSAILSQCNEILIFSSEPPLPYNGNATKYFSPTEPLLPKHANPQNINLFLRTTAAIHMQGNKTPTSTLEPLLSKKAMPNNNIYLFFKPTGVLLLTYYSECQAMLQNTFFILRTNAAIHRQCNKKLTYSSEPMLQYSCDATK